MDDLDLGILGLDDDEELTLDIPVPCPGPQPPDPPVGCISSNLPVPAKLNTLEDIRSIWLAARSPQEVAVQAQTMPFGVWMDYAIKLTPKQVDIKGQIDMRAAFVNLGPPPPRK